MQNITLRDDANNTRTFAMLHCSRPSTNMSVQQNIYTQVVEHGSSKPSYKNNVAFTLVFIILHNFHAHKRPAIFNFLCRPNNQFLTAAWVSAM